MTPPTIGRPLNLVVGLRAQPKRDWNWLPAVDLVVIGLFFGLLGSRFVAVPGVEIALPTSGLTEVRRGAPPVVLTVSLGGGLYAGTERVPPEALESTLARLAGDRPVEDRRLLLKLDRAVPTDELLALLDTVRAAGFAHVQLATATVEDGEDLFL